MKNERGYTIVGLVLMLILLFGVGGWIANIVKLVGMDFDHLTGMLIVRAVGIFLAPLGAVMGYIPS